MLNDETASACDPLYWHVPGSVLECPDGTFIVRGRYRSFSVSADGTRCACGKVGGCAHREALSEYFSGNERACPCCKGNGLRMLSRTDKVAVMGGEPVDHFTCAACDGNGSVTVRRRAALEAGMRRKKRAA